MEDEAELKPVVDQLKMTNLFKPLTLITAALAITVLGVSCTNKSNSRLNVTPDYLSISGRAADSDGAMLPGVEIRITGLNEALSVSNQDGSYKFAVSDQQLAGIHAERSQQLGNASNGHFRLLLEATDDIGAVALSGISEPIAFSQRGEFDAGAVVVGRAATVSGTVQEFLHSGDYQPVAGVTVIGGRSEGVSDAEGRFSLWGGLPAGKIMLYTLGGGFAAGSHEVELRAGESLDLSYPLVAFPENVVTGVVTAMSQEDQGELVNAGHPYRRKFKVNASPLATRIRYHHSEEALTGEQADTLWKPILQSFPYDFSEHGTNTLYYQFADAGNKVSDIMSITVPVDVFADSTGIVIGDGSGIITSRRVVVQVDLPAAAVKMRLAEDRMEFVGVQGNQPIPWVEASSSIEYLFELYQEGNSTQTRELYCQFMSGDGAESVLYRASAQMNVFSDATDIFSIEGGVPESPKRLVTLDINIPDNAYEMRIFEEQVSGMVFIGGVPQSIPSRNQLMQTFIRVEESIEFIFLSAGRKTVFLQFRDRDGVESPLYKQEINIKEWQPDTGGFVINDGAPSSVSRDVVLTFFPPDEAVAYHVAENLHQLQSMPYVVLKESIPYMVGGTGLRTIFVQYQNVTGTGSYVYSQEIYVDPFHFDSGDFVINGNAILTTDPVLYLDVMPPMAAVEMEILESEYLLAGQQVCGDGVYSGPLGRYGPMGPPVGNWQPVAPIAEMLVTGTGNKLICLRFMTATGESGPYLKRYIIYDPFPIDDGGVVINNDDLITYDRQVVLDIVVPPRATQMRVGSDAADLATAVFVVVDPFINYYLPEKASDVADKFHEVFVQFKSIDDEVSQVYRDDIQLELFPVAMMTMSINGGAATTSSPTLTLTLNPPPAVTGVKIADSSAALLTAPALVPSTSMSYTLSSATPGTKQIWVQYLAGGKTSGAMTGVIELVP